MPTIPLPHDGVIKEIRQDGNDIIFVFDNDIREADFVKTYEPEQKYLTMRFHLSAGINDLSMYIRKKPCRLFHKPGVIKETELSGSNKKLIELAKGKFNLEYLEHYVGYRSMIVKLWSSQSIILDMTVDFVELEWVSL